MWLLNSRWLAVTYAAATVLEEGRTCGFGGVCLITMSWDCASDPVACEYGWLENDCAVLAVQNYYVTWGRILGGIGDDERTCERSCRQRVSPNCGELCVFPVLIRGDSLRAPNCVNFNTHTQNNQILIKREPLVNTRAWRAVQKRKEKKEEKG